MRSAFLVWSASHNRGPPRTRSPLQGEPIAFSAQIRGLLDRSRFTFVAISSGHRSRAAGARVTLAPVQRRTVSTVCELRHKASCSIERARVRPREPTHALALPRRTDARARAELCQTEPPSVVTRSVIRRRIWSHVSVRHSCPKPRRRGAASTASRARTRDEDRPNGRSRSKLDPGRSSSGTAHVDSGQNQA